MSKSKKFKAPVNCTPEEICQIERDNMESGSYWVIVDGCTVEFVEQLMGKKPTTQISIPIKVFRRMMKFLRTPQELVKEKRSDGRRSRYHKQETARHAK